MLGTIKAFSGLWRSAPVPLSDQPWYINAVALLETRLEPLEVLEVLQRIEADFGRVRDSVNAPRVLDLDILDYGGRVMTQNDLVLPHPRMTSRAFVLLPLAQVAPDWVHPISRCGIQTLIKALPPDQEIAPYDPRA